MEPAMDIDRVKIRERKAGHLAQAALLLAALGALLLLVGWATFGPAGVAAVALVGAFWLALSRRIAPGLMLRLRNGSRIGPAEAPWLFDLLGELAWRAELPAPPRVYHLAGGGMNAFSMGMQGGPVIAVSDGLLRGLNRRELAGVMAHEIAHIRHGDLWVMSLVQGIAALVRTIALAGVVLLLLQLPFFLSGALPFPWLLLLVLMTAPTAGLLLQLALSRNREFDADLEAARLTGDPRGLAGALNKLEQLQGRIWERMLPPGWRLLQPALLRSHPHTGQRIARLLELAGLPPAPRQRLPLPGRLSLPGLIRPMAGV